MKYTSTSPIIVAKVQEDRERATCARWDLVELQPHIPTTEFSAYYDFVRPELLYILPFGRCVH